MNSFEQVYTKINHSKELSFKNVQNQSNHFKKQIKNNIASKNKNPSNYNHPRYPFDLYQNSVMSNTSFDKNLNRHNPNKSKNKKSKRQDINYKNNQQYSLMKKSSTLQLTTKQKQIREAIEYRFDKSKMKTYQLSWINSDQISLPNTYPQICDPQQDQIFSHLYGYLTDLHIIDLYQYHKFKENHLQPQEKKNNKIIVIKNNKKKKYNSDTFLSFDQSKIQNQKPHKSNTRLVNSNNNHGHYFSIHPIQSQRNHTDSSTYCYQRIKSESPAPNFKLQFSSSKAFQKDKSVSRSKIKTDHSIAINDKIFNSSSIQRKNFKHIKGIYLNAISNLANKNTVKSNQKLFRSQNQMRNKESRSALYESQKKGHKNDYSSSRHGKNNGSSSALQQNYFSCISSRQNRKDEKFQSDYNQKETKQKLDKTLLINELNPSQWKSIIMKVNDNSKSQSKQINNEVVANQSQKFRLKLKDHELNKIHKNGLNKAHGKFLAYPHSYRENAKSPKFKRYILNEDEVKNFTKQAQKSKNVNSVKSINNHSYDELVDASSAFLDQSVYKQCKRMKK